MKKIIVAIFTLVAFSSCNEQKIGFVDNGELINEFQEKKDLENKYKLKNDAFTKKRDSISQAFQIEYAALNKRQQQSGALNQKAQFLQQQLQIEQQQLQQGFQTEIDSIISKVNTFVEDYGKTNNYTFILGKNEAGSVMFGKAENDLTQDILEGLNKDSKKEEASEKEE